MKARISASWPEKVFEIQLINSSPSVSQLSVGRRCAERGTVTRRSRVGDWFNNGETNRKNLGRDGQTGLPGVGLYLGTACSFRENSIRKKNGLTFNRNLDSCEETDERRDKKHTHTHTKLTAYWKLGTVCHYWTFACDIISCVGHQCGVIPPSPDHFLLSATTRRVTGFFFYETHISIITRVPAKSSRQHQFQ